MSRASRRRPRASSRPRAPRADRVVKDGGSLAVLIDGYNLLHAIPKFAPRGADLAPARERLEAWLAEAAARNGVAVCVLVWDGGDSRRSRGPLQIVQTRAGVSADERILDLCRERFAGRAASTWVVSSDRDIQIPARELGFVVVGAMTFYRRWESPSPGRRGRDGSSIDPGSRTRPRPTRSEVDELLDAFLEADRGDE
jgi:predicted RNA-binding protein with PIN domain